MSDQRALEGRVALVTGSSRGIGRAMSLRLAREGAAVVITGKSEAGTDKLPGSIHTVAAEVEAAGGSALAVRVDVRHEDEVKAMVDATIERFGRLDILINNAGRALVAADPADAAEALRPHVGDQRSRGVSVRLLRAPAHGREPLGTRHQLLTADQHAAEPRACRLHDHQDGHDPARDRHRGRARSRTASPAIRCGR